MNLSIQITERHFLFLVGILAVVSAIGIATGYGTTDPQNFGHTPGELAAGTFGDGDYIFPDNLDVGNSINVQNNLDVGNDAAVQGSLTAQGDIAVVGELRAGSTKITCPSGFTSVESQERQLGCIQNAEQGAAQWEDAAQDCFNTFGGRLPTDTEWYLAMANYELTDENDDWEWNGDVSGSAADIHVVRGHPNYAITFQTTRYDTYADAYRCWISA